MCFKKDINLILEQLQNCDDHEEKRRILEQLDGCSTCIERPHAITHEKTRCGCESYQHIEFLNIIEHVIQQCIFAKNK